MILEEAINLLLRNSCDAILGTPGYFIRAKQKDAPRPVGSYGTIEFLDETPVGQEQIEKEDIADPSVDLNFTYTGARVIRFTVNTYRANALDNARRIRAGMCRTSNIQAFSSLGVGYNDVSVVRNITSPLSTNWEERGSLDVTLNTVSQDSEIIRSIQSVDLTLLFHARGIIQTQTVRVQ